MSTDRLWDLIPSDLSQCCMNVVVDNSARLSGHHRIQIHTRQQQGSTVSANMVGAVALPCWAVPPLSRCLLGSRVGKMDPAAQIAGINTQASLICNARL